MSKKKAELTPKQRRYVKQRIENPTKSKCDCAIDAGYSAATAHNATVKVENGCREKLLAAMKRARINDRYLIGKLKEGLNAKQTQLFAHKGIIRDKRQLIDYNARRAYLEIAHKLRGDFVEKIEHTGDISIQLVSPEEKDV